MFFRLDYYLGYVKLYNIRYGLSLNYKETKEITMSGRFITIIVLIAIVFIYVLYNTQSVGVKFLFWETHASKALITLGSFLAGIILGFVLAKIDQFNKERKRKALQKQSEQEEERG
jgi:uncharacterized integral membrane protein